MNSEVIYRDHDHTYWCNGVRYTSATQALDKFKNHFDVEAQSTRYAEKAGATPEVWQERWDDIRVRSLVRGNKIHNEREELTLSRGVEVHAGRPLPVPNPALYGERTPLIYWPDGVYTEVILHSHRYRLAGRCDKLVLYTENGIRYGDIDDYKTNRIIRFNSYRDRSGTAQMMRYPLEHLEDCNFIHYEIQVSEYFVMLEEMGIRAGAGRIIHFPHVPEMAPPGAKPPVPKAYVVRYRKDDVHSMLQQLPHV